MAQPTHQWRPPERDWREQDLFDLPEDGNRYEIVDGSLHVTPPAGPEHHELADDIRMTFKPGAPRDRMWAEWTDLALVIEVESPNSRRHDRLTKPALHAEAGIPSYWRVERGDLGPVVHR